MAKSKKKSPVMRFAQHDYDFCLSHPSSSNDQRFPNVVNSNHETRVRTKHRKRDMQRTPLVAPPQPSPRPYSRFGAGNPNFEPTVGTAPSSPPKQGITTSRDHKPSTSHHHTNLWWSSLIGFIAGKFQGYISLYKYVHNTWSNVNFSMHDTGWLIFKFTSELDMYKVLSGGPYYVFGQLLILKIMPEYFDFDTTDMIRMPIWVRFPNLPLQCWSPLCLSKLASVIGKLVHFDSPTTSMSWLSYAKVRIEVDLLAKLPLSINITLPNAATPSGCSNPSADTKANDKQPTRKEPKVVHVSEDHSDATAALPPRRQYLTRSKAAASSAFDQTRKLGQPFKSSSSADSKIQGSTTFTPSSSL
ncbi:hypothetical protein NC651_026847 [Populus alba x Populus x berolinensis]|nr:hypothetical protein NC651_026847 [Populus alba x Populus x berolinensis]